MKKNTGHWLKRARTKAGLLQKDIAGDRFTRSYISQVEKGDAKLSPNARILITRKLKLPKSYFDTGLYTDEKKRLDGLIKDIDKLSDSYIYTKAENKALNALKISQEAKNDDYTNSLLIKLARIYIKTDRLNKAEDILEKTNEYYSEEKDFKNLAYSYYWTGIAYREKKKHRDAVLILNKSIEENYKLKRKKDLSLISRALSTMAQIYRINENYKAAKETIKEATEIALKSKDEYVIAMAYWEYGFLFHRIGEYEDSIKYYSLASPIYKKLGYEKLSLQVNNNIASLYHYKREYDKAIKLTKDVIKISKDKNYNKELAYAYLKGAKAKRDKNLLNEAEDDLNKAIVLFNKIKKEERMLGEAYMSLGLLHEKKKENDLAIKNFNKAVDIFKTIDQEIYINSAYGEIIRFYKSIGAIDEKREYAQDLINTTNKLIDKTKKIIF